MHCTSKWIHYRPQRSCGQGNVFTGVCLSTGGEGVCLSACWDAIPPWIRWPPPGTGRHPPPGPGRPPRPVRHPPRSGSPPGTRQTPPREADSSIRSTSGRYASYWNAFLFTRYPLVLQFPFCYMHNVSLCICRFTVATERYVGRTCRTRHEHLFFSKWQIYLSHQGKKVLQYSLDKYAGILTVKRRWPLKRIINMISIHGDMLSKVMT